MNLPDNHEAWSYMNPTMVHFETQTSPQNLNEKAAQHVRDFKNWLDGTLFINHELKEKTKLNHVQSSQDTANPCRDDRGKQLRTQVKTRTRKFISWERNSQKNIMGRKKNGRQRRIVKTMVANQQAKSTKEKWRDRRCHKPWGDDVVLRLWPRNAEDPSWYQHLSRVSTMGHWL